MKMSVWSLACRQSVFQWYHSEDIYQSFTHKMAARASWHWNYVTVTLCITVEQKFNADCSDDNAEFTFWISVLVRSVNCMHRCWCLISKFVNTSKWHMPLHIHTSSGRKPVRGIGLRIISIQSTIEVYEISHYTPTTTPENSNASWNATDIICRASMKTRGANFRNNCRIWCGYAAWRILNHGATNSMRSARYTYRQLNMPVV